MSRSTPPSARARSIGGSPLRSRAVAPAASPSTAEPCRRRRRESPRAAGTGPAEAGRAGRGGCDMVPDFSRAAVRRCTGGWVGVVRNRPPSVPAGVGAEREGALGAASAEHGVVGDDAVKELVAAAGVGGAEVAVGGGVAELAPPVGDIAPSGRGEGAAELLHGQRRAQGGEAQPLLERPLGQGA